MCGSHILTAGPKCQCLSGKTGTVSGWLGGLLGGVEQGDGCNVRLWIAASRVHSHTPHVTSNGLNLEVGEILTCLALCVWLQTPDPFSLLVRVGN